METVYFIYFLVFLCRDEHGWPRFNIPAGHAPISPMGIQTSSDEEKPTLGDRTMEQGASSLPEVHGDFGLQTSEQEEALKQDREFEHIAKIQDEMYKKLGAVLPLGDVPRPDIHGDEKSHEMEENASPEEQSIERFPSDESKEEQHSPEEQHMRNVQDEDDQNDQQHMKDMPEDDRNEGHIRHDDNDHEDERHMKRIPDEEEENDEPNYNSYKKDNLPVNTTATSNLTNFSNNTNMGNDTAVRTNDTNDVKNTGRNVLSQTTDKSSIRDISIESSEQKSANLEDVKMDVKNNTQPAITQSGTQPDNKTSAMQSSTNSTNSPDINEEKAKQEKTRRRRTVGFKPTVKKKQKKTLRFEKTKHSKGGKKNSVVVQRPPIIYHPPPEIIHRPPLIFHRPAIVIQRPVIVYHQPLVIVHRPAILYNQPSLIFHQPPPVIHQPLFHSHDKFAADYSLKHIGSVIEPGGEIPILPKNIDWQGSVRGGGRNTYVKNIGWQNDRRVGRMGGNSAHYIETIAPHVRYTSRMHDVATNVPSVEDAGNILMEDASSLLREGNIKPLHENESNTAREGDVINDVGLSSGSQDGNLVSQDGALSSQDGTLGQIEGQQFQGFSLRGKSNENEVPIASGTRKSKVQSHHKLHENFIGNASYLMNGTRKSQVGTKREILNRHNGSRDLRRGRRQVNVTAIASGRKGVKKDVVVNRPPIIYHPPPEIYHRPDIVIHRPPIVIHRPPIIYHQPPVIVHRPAVVYHQPPIVFHQPPPAVQQPLLYSHDTFVMHPTFIAKHLGSILRTAPHYIGPPRMLTNMGEPIMSGSGLPMSYDSEEFNSHNLDDRDSHQAMSMADYAVNEEEGGRYNSPMSNEKATQQAMPVEQQNTVMDEASYERQNGVENRAEQYQQEDNMESMQAVPNRMVAPQQRNQEMMQNIPTEISKRSHINKSEKPKPLSHSKNSKRFFPGSMKQIFDKLYNTHHSSQNHKQNHANTYNIIDQRPGLMRRKTVHHQDNKIPTLISDKPHAEDEGSDIMTIQHENATEDDNVPSGEKHTSGNRPNGLHKKVEETETATKRFCMDYHDSCCHEMCPPRHVHHVHHHHRHIHHEDHQIVLHRPGVIYHPAPTVVHRPDIIIHRPPLLVHRPVIVVHQPPVILHRPPVYYKQPDVIFHTPHSIVREPTIYSHDIYTHVPHLQQVDSHIENHELTTHIGDQCGGHMGDVHGYGCNNGVQGETYHDKGVGDYYNTAKYGEMGGDESEEEQDDSRSAISHDGDNNYIRKATGEDENNVKRLSIPSSDNNNNNYNNDDHHSFHLKVNRTFNNATKRQEISQYPQFSHGIPRFRVEPATHEIHSPIHHRHHRHLHVGEQNIVLHRPGVIYHPSPTVVHRPIIVIHRPPLLVHRPSIVVHQPPVVIHRPPVYYKQPDVVFHTPPPEVHEPMYQSHDLYKQVPRLERVNSHIEQSETLVHPMENHGEMPVIAENHSDDSDLTGYHLQGEHYHGKGLGDVYGTENYGNIKPDIEKETTGASRSYLPFHFDKEYDIKNNDNIDNIDSIDDTEDMNESGATRDTVTHIQDPNNFDTGMPLHQ